MIAKKREELGDAPDFLWDRNYRLRKSAARYFRQFLFSMLYCVGLAIFLKQGIGVAISLVFFLCVPMVLLTMVLRWLVVVLRRAPILVAVGVWVAAFAAIMTLSIFDVALILPSSHGPSLGAIAGWIGRVWWWLYPALIFWALLATAFQGIVRKVGPSVFVNWVRGYYRQPREETRIFMFLDMRDSTTLAESLGHVRFGALLRDFMADLSDAVGATKGEISHYIGDEAVLTWRPEKGFPRAQCVECFFRFKAVLERRRSYYESTYGVFPRFKAGLHYGTVTATEVGELKSEIVFLGDVLNTTSRIQSVCKEFDAELLISGEAASQLPALSWLKMEPVGAVELKGKANPVDLVKAELRTDLALP